MKFLGQQGYNHTDQCPKEGLVETKTDDYIQLVNTRCVSVNLEVATRKYMTKGKHVSLEKKNLPEKFFMLT